MDSGSNLYILGFLGWWVSDASLPIWTSAHYCEPKALLGYKGGEDKVAASDKLTH